jgi:single-strand DNA-binding protein
MTAIQTTITGNLAGDPELRFTPAGVPVASFTVAANERYKDQAGQWQDGPSSFLKCNAWRELAEHIAETLVKGDRLIVTGTLRQRSYETKEGEKRTIWELAAAEVGASLKYATAKVSKVRRDQAPPPEDPWAADQAPTPDGPASDEPPF